ncbi:MAG: anhydro-N-acetylmuramic acid kinase [Bacteroidota bacterium]|nr:anhydro-N-acetylmuramic acid kinase [Bacteroidota bacterium]
MTEGVKVFHVIGLMSGTSLDGLDIASCKFRFEDLTRKWSFRIYEAETVSYPEEWTNRLASVEKSSAEDLARTDVEYGHWLGRAVHAFIDKHGINPDFIASHGHTIFHQPDAGFTTQIGKGAAIAAETGFPVICDFRSTDVAFGGQGAPLVPAGDRLLFPSFQYCLNIGGFANISFEKESDRIAYDICPANIILNRIARKSGKCYDKDGIIAASGKIDPKLLNALNSLDYYKISSPKSLGKEWLLTEFVPLIEKSAISLEDKMRTVTEHIAIQIAGSLDNDSSKQALVTGGGALNLYLMRLIGEKTNTRIVIPDLKTIQFKEALIFAFLGVLRQMGEFNTLSSVTGAQKNTSGGCIYI